MGVRGGTRDARPQGCLISPSPVRLSTFYPPTVPTLYTTLHKADTSPPSAGSPHHTPGLPQHRYDVCQPLFSVSRHEEDVQVQQEAGERRMDAFCGWWLSSGCQDMGMAFSTRNQRSGGFQAANATTDQYGGWADRQAAAPSPTFCRPAPFPALISLACAPDLHRRRRRRSLRRTSMRR